MDIIFPNCDSVSTSSGIGTGCNINIAYNQQVAICRDEASKYRSGDKLELACRGLGGLCQADEGFDFNFDPTSEASLDFPLSTVIDGQAVFHLHPRVFPPLDRCPAPSLPSCHTLHPLPVTTRRLRHRRLHRPAHHHRQFNRRRTSGWNFRDSPKSWYPSPGSGECSM